MSQKLKFPNLFLEAGQDPYATLRWKKVQSEIKNRRGEVFFSMKNVEAPITWSQLAIDIAASKYFRKNGVPKHKSETSIRQMIDRVVSAIAASGKKQGGYFASTKDEKAFSNELKYILLTQKGAFNSPVWFNAGLWESYKISSPSEHFDLLRRTLAGYARHSNLAGVLIVGLGCERNQVDGLMESQGLHASQLLRSLVMQDTGGTRATIAAGIAAIEEMLPVAHQARRQPVSASHLKIGLECGGSDGFSGITANPALGAAMDILVRHGGTAILSETPEIHGVEFMLTRRAISPAVGQKLLDRLAWWERYTAGQNAQFNGVVGHGNQAGGLANIFEKSLGSAMKGGTTPLRAVYEYAEPITESGFVFMDSPGYDPVASTGQIAGGANLICFTTGRGSMFGSKPAPTIKLASNTPMYQRLSEDMDINCGLIVDGECTVPEMGERIFEQILRHASGEATKSEQLGLGDHEFVPWHLGIVS